MSTLLTGLYLYYKLDESSWTTANDSVGSINWTLIGSPTFTSWWKINNWLYYDWSARRHIDIWTQIAGSFWDNDFSFSCWYKPDSITQEPTFLLCYNRDIQVRYWWNNDLQIGIRNWSVFHTASAWAVLSNNNRSHIVATRSKTNWMTIYHNGVLEWTNSYTGNGLITTDGDFDTTKIWRRYSLSPARDFRLDWTLDEVWIRSKELTASEVSELYNWWKWLQYPFQKSTWNFLLMF